MRQLLKDRDLGSFLERHKLIYFLSHRWQSMLTFAIFFALVFEGVFLTTHSVSKILANQDRNRERIEKLINQTNDIIKQSDHNTKALDCILDVLGTGESIQRSSVENCRASASASDPTASPASFSGPSFFAAPPASQTSSNISQAQPQASPTPNPTAIDRLNGFVNRTLQ